MPIFHITPSDSPYGLPQVKRDNFCWSAFWLPPLWALFNAMPMIAVGWLVAVAALAGISLYIGSEASCWLYVLGAVWFGIEARGLAFSKKPNTYPLVAENNSDALLKAVVGSEKYT